MLYDSTLNVPEPAAEAAVGTAVKPIAASAAAATQDRIVRMVGR
jgi:hypothetical protein